MKRLISLLTIFILLLCSGCTPIEPEINPDTIRRNGAVMVDYFIYHTTEELFDASTYIFEGKITDISAEVLNYQTGKPQRTPIGSSDPDDFSITTVYTVQVTKSYKGNTKMVEHIVYDGGNWDELLVEQAQALRRAGMYNAEENRYLDESFKDISPTRNLKKDTVYLFCVRDVEDLRDDLTWETDYRIITNPSQFAAEKDSKLYNLLKEQLPYSPPPVLIFTVTSVVVLGVMLLLQPKRKKTETPQE